MLNEFVSWMKAGYGYECVRHDHELTSSAVIDFENADVIGRFTVWDDFSCMSEVIEIATAAYRVNKRFEFSRPDELKEFFIDKFVFFLGRGGANLTQSF